MSTAEKRKLAKTLKRRAIFWADVLNLNHWRIDLEVHTELSDPDALASCSPNEYYDTATIKVVEDWEARAGEDQTLDYIVVHELLHIHLRDLDETFQSTVGNLGSVGDGYRRSWTRAEEALIDRLTYALIDNVVISGVNDS